MKRTVFKNRWLPYLLVLPQMAVTVVFFFWPAFKSLQLSVFRVSPFGDRTTFVGLDNFAKLLADPEYYASVVTSFVFAGSVTVLVGGTGARGGGTGDAEDPGPRRVPDAAAVAVRHRARGGGHHLPVHLPSVLRDPAVLPLLRDHL